MTQQLSKGKHLIEGGLHLHHGGKHGGMKADVVVEKELRVLLLHLQEENAIVGVA